MNDDEDLKPCPCCGSGAYFDWMEGMMSWMVLGSFVRLPAWIVIGSMVNLDWLQIWIAPKIWLIEYAATLVGGK